MASDGYTSLLSEVSHKLFHNPPSFTFIENGTDPRRFSGPWRPIGPTLSSPSHACGPGNWLADLCAQEGIPYVLGHALSMKALHGGQAKHDTIDGHKIAVLLRGGMLSQAYVYPTVLRATRDLRRRMPRMHTRAEWLTHIQHTHRQWCRSGGIAVRFPTGSGPRLSPLVSPPAPGTNLINGHTAPLPRRPHTAHCHQPRRPQEAPPVPDRCTAAQGHKHPHKG
jgi:hypothetical protein